jgi:predicted Zn-dependent protease
VIALGCLALIIWSLFALKDPIIDLVAQVIPRSWERKLGDIIYMGVRAQSSIIDDSDLDRDFQTLISPLMSAVKDTGYTFDFHIAKDQDLNAFALPGGIIVVHAGTILQSDRPEELLGVLAHELSHVTCRHTTKQAITVFGLYFIVDVVLGNVFGTVAALSQGAFYLLQQGFSREHEQEADLEGLNFLQKANVDPMGMVDFFGKLKTEYEKVPVLGELERSLSFLSTHPATDDRITYLTEKIRESGTTEYKPLSKSDLEAFKVKLRGKL